MSKVLIVVDMQNDFVTGSLGSKEAREIVPNVKSLHGIHTEKIIWIPLKAKNFR